MEEDGLFQQRESWGGQGSVGTQPVCAAADSRRVRGGWKRLSAMLNTSALICRLRGGVQLDLGECTVETESDV